MNRVRDFLEAILGIIGTVGGIVSGVAPVIATIIELIAMLRRNGTPQALALANTLESMAARAEADPDAELTAEDWAALRAGVNPDAPKLEDLVNPPGDPS